MAATVLETLPSEFDYFGQIPAHTTLTADGYEPILPTSPIAAQQARSKIIFKIPGISSCYRDLAKSFMVVKCRVVAANNANLGANDEIAPVNLMLSSLFSSVDVSICNKQINDTCTLYPYRAFLENLLTYDADVHPMRTVTAGWELDMDAETMDLLLIAAANNVEPNPAHVKRNALINTSRSCTLVGRIHADIFNQSLAIPAECEILVSFTPATDSFVLMAAANATFKVIIDSACLMVRSLSATTDLVLAHRRMVDKTNFRFPYDKVDVQAFVVSPGVTQKI